MLKFIENKYIYSSFKVKIELYLLVFLLSYFFIYQIDLSLKSNNINLINEKPIKKIKTKSNIQLTRIIENYCDKNRK